MNEEAARILASAILKLAEAIALHAHAMVAGDEDDEAPRTYMDGTPVR